MKCTWLELVGDGVKHVIIAALLAVRAVAHDALRGAGGEMPLDLVGQRRRAVEHHAERIVELPEIGIVDQLAGVFRRDEAADRDAEAHDRGNTNNVRASTLILRAQIDSPARRDARASRSAPAGGQVKRSRWPGTGRDASGVFSTMRAICSIAARNASALAPAPGATTSDSTSPREAGISS